MILDFLPLAVIGWDDFIMAIVGSLVSAGANAAMSPDVNSKSTTPGLVPPLQEPDQDPFAMANSMMAQRQARKNRIATL